MCACSATSHSATLWTRAHQLLCPWYSLGKDAGVGCHALLWGIFLTQGSNPCLLCLLHCRWIPYCWTTQEACICTYVVYTCIYCIYMYVYSICTYIVYTCVTYIYIYTHIQYTMVGWGTYSHQGKTSFTVYHRLCCICWKRYKWRDEYYNAYKYWVL